MQTQACDSGTCPAVKPPCQCYDIPPTGSTLNCIQQVRRHRRQLLQNTPPTMPELPRKAELTALPSAGVPHGQSAFLRDLVEVSAGQVACRHETAGGYAAGHQHKRMLVS